MIKNETMFKISVQNEFIRKTGTLESCYLTSVNKQVIGELNIFLLREGFSDFVFVYYYRSINIYLMNTLSPNVYDIEKKKT